MSKLGYFIRCVLGLQEIDVQPPPRDAREFEIAKKNLKDSSRAFSREIDRFGDMVYGMRDRPAPALSPGPRRRRSPPKKTAAKKRTGKK